MQEEIIKKTTAEWVEIECVLSDLKEQLLRNSLVYQGMRVLRWIRRELAPPQYELQCNGKSIGSLSWVQGTRTAAVAETAGRILVLRKEGFLGQRVVVETPAGESVASIRCLPFSPRGMLRLADGQKYLFCCDKALIWTDEKGDLLVEIAHSEGGGAVVNTPQSVAQIPLILMVAGLYLQLTRWKKGRTWLSEGETGLSPSVA